MIHNFNCHSKVFSYLFKSYLLSFLFAFIASVLGGLWFILFLFCFLTLPIFIFLYRDINVISNSKIKCLSPVSGIITDLKKNEIFITSSFFDLYFLKSPITGVIRKIEEFKNKSINKNLLIEVENNEGIFKIEVFSNKFVHSIDLFVEKGKSVLQGENLCFLEFGFSIKLTIPENLEFSMEKNYTLNCGTSCLVV